MAVIICGHQRSGTSLLRKLCDSHPAIKITNEFGNFFDLDAPYNIYRRQILKRWWRAKNRSFLFSPRQLAQLRESETRAIVKASYRPIDTARKFLRINMLQNLNFVTRYLLNIAKEGQGCVNIGAIDAALRSIFPVAHIVGDKHPDYIFEMNKLAGIEKLSSILIYRDPRDVVHSTLEAYHRRWGKWWSAETAIVERIAERWVQSTDFVEGYRDNIHVIRYEELTTNPQQTLKALANWLDVDDQRFQHQMIHSNSIGKYRGRLSDQDLTVVIQVAGSTMERLGYQI